MKNKNKLTLKYLQQQLDELKVFKAKDINSKVKKVEQVDSKSTVTHMKGSFIQVYLISWVLLLLNKIPILNKITTILKLYYGRTSFWTLLIILRKVFIIINAIIGVLAVFKLTGLGGDTILANFVGMGYSYIDLFTNMTKKLFNWFLDLFDYKVVPNNNNNWFGGNNIPKKPLLNDLIDTQLHESLRKTYKNQPSSVFSDWSTWLWIIGGVTITAGIVFAGYMGYSYYQTLYGSTNIQGTSKFPGSGTPPVNPEIKITSPNDSFIPEDLSGNENITNQLTQSIIAVLSNTKRLLNPFNWFTNTDVSSAERFFKGKQNELSSYDSRFYPFTPNDPFKPWYDRLRINIFGETVNELKERLRAQDFALRDYTSIALKPWSNTIAQTPSGLGLGTGTPSNIYYNSWTEYINTYNKIYTAPQIPLTLPSDFIGPSGSTSPGVVRGVLTQSYPQIPDISLEWANNTLKHEDTLPFNNIDNINSVFE